MQILANPPVFSASFAWLSRGWPLKIQLFFCYTISTRNSFLKLSWHMAEKEVNKLWYNQSLSRLKSVMQVLEFEPSGRLAEGSSCIPSSAWDIPAHHLVYLHYVYTRIAPTLLVQESNAPLPPPAGWLPAAPLGLLSGAVLRQVCPPRNSRLIKGRRNQRDTTTTHRPSVSFGT